MAEERKRRHIGRLLHRLDLLMSLQLRSAGDDLVPPNQLHALEYIRLHPGCTQAELAAAMQVSASSTAQTLRRMEASQFIERDICRTNLRANCLHITDNGIAAAESCRSVFDSLNERMLSGLSEDERDTVRTLLERMVRNLESSDTGRMNNAELVQLVMQRRDGGGAPGR